MATTRISMLEIQRGLRAAGYPLSITGRINAPLSAGGGNVQVLRYYGIAYWTAYFLALYARRYGLAFDYRILSDRWYPSWSTSAELPSNVALWLVTEPAVQQRQLASLER